MLDTDRDLLAQAVCLHYDPDIWHEPATEERAVKLCLTGDGGRPCPALALCLEKGTNPENVSFTQSGVWGGVTPGTRNRIRARRHRGEDPRYPIVTFTTTDCQTRVSESVL